MTVLSTLEVLFLIVGACGQFVGLAYDLRGDHEAADRVAWRTGWCIGAYWMLQSIEDNMDGRRVQAIMDTITAAVILWLWWHQHRNRRRKIAEKAAARVRDLGHRLAVEPVAAEG